jgi:hypothetical protein
VAPQSRIASDLFPRGSDRRARHLENAHFGRRGRSSHEHGGALPIESHDGRDLYYVEAVERPSSLWRLPLTGGAAVKVLDGVVLGNFDVVEGGIYYIDRASLRR